MQVTLNKSNITFNGNSGINVYMYLLKVANYTVFRHIQFLIIHYLKPL